MKLTLALLFFGVIFAAPKLDPNKTKLRNCQEKEQIKEYEEFFLPDGEQENEDKEDWG